MSTPPEQYKNTRKKPRNRLKPKPGSKKYRHLLKFIETRRQKKREKRCTLDRSAQVFLSLKILPQMMMMMMQWWRWL